MAKAEQFEPLFGHLKIGQNPTPRHNQFFVMNWDFSSVDSTGSAEDIRQRLHNHINGCIEDFANEVMMARQLTSLARYETLIQEEGTLKAVLKKVKAATKGLGVDRIFITGVSPVVMSDMSSGFNIAKNLYLNPKFNDLCGFWEAEILATLQQLATECGFEEQTVLEALAVMRADGYRFFSRARHQALQFDISLYFLDTLQEKNSYQVCLKRRIIEP